MAETRQLLADYVQNGSESSFRELVTRYIDLVHSTAVRMVDGDSHRAQDVTQVVFTDLARLARTLPPAVMLGGWLHRHTCFVASNVMRGERRRHHREQQAVQMNSHEDHSETNLTEVTPILDDAINQLKDEDRQAILLRFYEQQDFRAVGHAIGSNEDAARKRVHRALEKLELLLKRRGVVFSAAYLASVLSAKAVTAAPVGLATGVSASALAVATGSAGSGTLTFITIMNTKMKLAVVGTLAAVAVAIPLTFQQKTLRQQQVEIAGLRGQLQEMASLKAENERLAEQLTRTPIQQAQSSEPNREVLQLKGEIGRLRTAAAIPKPSALSGLTANPEMMKMIRDQQKNAFSMIYKELIKDLKLSQEDAEQLNHLLADNVMTNIEHISSVLRDGRSAAEMDQLFASQETALLDDLRALLGEEGLAEYNDYTRNLLGSITVQQFRDSLTGDSETRLAKTTQLRDLLKVESQQVLAREGLSANYQLIPTLNFRNFASQEEEDRNLRLLDEVYTRVGTQANAFLNDDELQKWNAYREKALSSSRTILAMNRKLMAPQAQ